jgi:hypothetical protein
MTENAGMAIRAGKIPKRSANFSPFIDLPMLPP